MKPIIFFLVLLMTSFTSFAQSKKNKATQAIALLSGTSEAIPLSGKAIFVEANDGNVHLELSVSGLRPLSKHAIHIHEEGDCGNGGKNAKGHWNPNGHKHGFLLDHQKGNKAHKGDLGNLFANEDGEATLHLSTTEWCIDCNDKTKNILGKGIIIHEGKDDLKTQPTGGAGGRIGCGVILRTTQQQ